MDEETNWSQTDTRLEGFSFQEQCGVIADSLLTVQNMTAFRYSSVQICLDT